MSKTIYLNFSDLKEEVQNDLLYKAIEDIENDKEQVEEIENTWGERSEEIIRERAERELYNFNYVFNV